MERGPSGGLEAPDISAVDEAAEAEKAALETFSTRVEAAESALEAGVEQKMPSLRADVEEKTAPAAAELKKVQKELRRRERDAATVP